MLHGAMLVLQRKIIFMCIALKANQCDIANGTKTCVPSIGLPSEIIKHVKEVFDELSDNKLLTKCLHGKNPKSE